MTKAFLITGTSSGFGRLLTEKLPEVRHQIDTNFVGSIALIRASRVARRRCKGKHVILSEAKDLARSVPGSSRQDPSLRSG